MKTIVNEAIYTRGSYVRIIVPDKSLVDFIVSNSVVSGKVGTESVINKLYDRKDSILNITSDPTILMVNEKYKNSLSLIGTESKKIKKNSIIKNLRTMIDSNKPSKIIKRSELVTKVDDIHYTWPDL